MDAPRIIVKPPGPGSQQVMERDKELVMRVMYNYLPVAFKRGEGSILEDVDGNRYIDFNAGIASMALGHSHPEIVEAIREQAATLIHNSRHTGYLEPYLEVAEKLRRILPGELSSGRVLLVNSGTEAVEAALKLARYASGKPGMIAFMPSFHGRALLALSATASKAAHRKRLTGLLPPTFHAPYPYPYRFPGPPEKAGSFTLQYISSMLNHLAPPDDVAGIIVEPISGEPGYIVPPDNFLPGLRKIADDEGLFLVADEVQSGLGRTGKIIACEHWHVIPDIVIFAKAIASGLPLGAVVAKREIADAWEPGAHGTTFGGNPVACAAASRFLDILIKNRLHERAAELGRRLLSALRELVEEVENVGEVRGKGLMIGIELVEDKDTKKPAPKLAAKAITRCLEKGLVITKCGESTLRICPALNIPEDLLWRGVEILSETLREFKT